MRFEGNVARQPDPSGIIDMPDGVGYCASYYLDGVSTNSSLCFAFDNAAEGLPVGLRVQNIPDQNTNASSPIGNRPQLTLQFIYACGNAFINGSWHDIVQGPPSNDPDIENDPIENADAACDNGCPYDNNLWALVLIFFPILAIIFICCACYSNNNYPRIEYVQTSLGPIPKDRNLWPVLAYTADPQTGYLGSRPISPYAVYNSMQARAKRWREQRVEAVSEQKAVDRAYSRVRTPAQEQQLYNLDAYNGNYFEARRATAFGDDPYTLDKEDY